MGGGRRERSNKGGFDWVLTPVYYKNKLGQMFGLGVGLDGGVGFINNKGLVWF